MYLTAQVVAVSLQLIACTDAIWIIDSPSKFFVGIPNHCSRTVFIPEELDLLIYLLMSGFPLPLLNGTSRCGVRIAWYR